MAYGSFKDLNTRTAAVKVLQGKAFYITKHWKYDGYKCGLASIVYKFLIKEVLLEQLKMKFYLIKN